MFILLEEPEMAKIETMSLKELVALESKIKAAMESARAKGKAEIKHKVSALAQAHGFSVSELFGVRGKAKSKGAARYANPDDPSQTWTGRGRKPDWLRAYLKKGKKQDDFAI